MAFSDIELASIKKEMDAYISKIRPPVEIRNKIDIAYKVTGQSVEIYEVRPNMDGEYYQNHVAKTTFIGTSQLCMVYWQRADLKWHAFETPAVKSLTKFIELVENDELGCFWG